VTNARLVIGSIRYKTSFALDTIKIAI